MLELIESFSLLDPAVHHRSRFPEHFHEGPHVIKIGNHAVTRDDYHIRGKCRNECLKGSNESASGTSRGQINERKTDTKKIVAHVHNVRLGKIDDAVAISVAILKVHYLDIFAVEMNRKVVHR